MITAISNAFAGMQAASRQFETAAANVASPAATADTVTQVTDVLQAQDSMSLNVAVLRSALNAQKQVLDILV